MKKFLLIVVLLLSLIGIVVGNALYAHQDSNVMNRCGVGGSKCATID